MNHWYPSIGMILMLIAYLVYTDQLTSPSPFIVIFVGTVILVQFVIHLIFWVEDRNKELLIDEHRQILKFSKGTQERTYNFDDLLKIIKNGDGRYGFFKPPFLHYIYSTFIFKNGDIQIITTLISKEFPPFEDKTEIQLKWRPYIRKLNR